MVVAGDATSSCSRPASGAIRKRGATAGPMRASPIRSPSASPTTIRSRSVPGYVAADQQLPRPRRRDGHGQPQPELPRQFRRVVRHGLARVQGRLRPERRVPLGAATSRSSRTATSSARWPTTASALGIPVPVSLTLRSDGCTDPLSAQVNGRDRRRQHIDSAGCPTRRGGSPNRVRTEGGMFVQDKWTMNRLTLSAGFRIDWFDSQNPAFHLCPSLMTPNRNYDVPAFKHDALQGLDAEGRRRVRRVRRRQDGPQGQLRQVRARPGAGRRRPRQPARLQRPADLVAQLDRQQQELHSGLRPERTRHQGPTQTGADNQIDTCLRAVGAQRATSTATR